MWGARLGSSTSLVMANGPSELGLISYHDESHSTYTPLRLFPGSSPSPEIVGHSRPQIENTVISHGIQSSNTSNLQPIIVEEHGKLTIQYVSSHQV